MWFPLETCKQSYGQGQLCTTCPQNTGVVRCGIRCGIRCDRRRQTSGCVELAEIRSAPMSRKVRGDTGGPKPSRILVTKGAARILTV